VNVDVPTVPLRAVVRPSRLSRVVVRRKFDPAWHPPPFSAEEEVVRVGLVFACVGTAIEDAVVPLEN